MAFGRTPDPVDPRRKDDLLAARKLPHVLAVHKPEQHFVAGGGERQAHHSVLRQVGAGAREEDTGRLGHGVGWSGPARVGPGESPGTVRAQPGGHAARGRLAVARRARRAAARLTPGPVPCRRAGAGAAAVPAHSQFGMSATTGQRRDPMRLSVGRPLAAQPDAYGRVRFGATHHASRCPEVPVFQATGRRGAWQRVGGDMSITSAAAPG